MFAEQDMYLIDCQCIQQIRVCAVENVFKRVLQGCHRNPDNKEEDLSAITNKQTTSVESYCPKCHGPQLIWFLRSLWSICRIFVNVYCMPMNVIF